MTTFSGPFNVKNPFSETRNITVESSGSTVFYGPVTFAGGTSGTGGASVFTVLDVSGSSRLRGEVDVSATSNFRKQVILTRPLASTGGLISGVSDGAILIESQFSSTNSYFPGILWRASDSAPGKPRAGIFPLVSNAGTTLYFGTSNDSVSGITSLMFLDYNANLQLGGGLEMGGGLVIAGGVQASGDSLFYSNVTFGPSGRILLSNGFTVSASSVFHGTVTINAGLAVVSRYATIASNNTAGNPVSFPMSPNSSLIEAYVDTVIPWSDADLTRLKIGVSGSAMFFSNVAVSGTTATGIHQLASTFRTGTIKRWKTFSFGSGDATGTIKVFASAASGTTTGETIVTLNYTT